jgi:hypothetical protein
MPILIDGFNDIQLHVFCAKHMLYPLAKQSIPTMPAHSILNNANHMKRIVAMKPRVLYLANYVVVHEMRPQLKKLAR